MSFQLPLFCSDMSQNLSDVYYLESFTHVKDVTWWRHRTYCIIGQTFSIFEFCTHNPLVYLNCEVLQCIMGRFQICSSWSVFLFIHVKAHFEIYLTKMFHLCPTSGFDVRQCYCMKIFGVFSILALSCFFIFFLNNVFNKKRPWLVNYFCLHCSRYRHAKMTKAYFGEI